MITLSQGYELNAFLRPQITEWYARPFAGALGFYLFVSKPTEGKGIQGRILFEEKFWFNFPGFFQTVFKKKKHILDSRTLLLLFCSVVFSTLISSFLSFTQFDCHSLHEIFYDENEKGVESFANSSASVCSTWHRSVGRVQNPGKRAQICERQQKPVKFIITTLTLYETNQEGERKSV